MSDDLVKRLRLGADYAHDTEPMHEAADHIETLTAERDALEKACKEWADVSQANYQMAKRARDKALEEAAIVAERCFVGDTLCPNLRIAAVIRALRNGDA